MIKFSLLIILSSTPAQGGVFDLAKLIYKESSAAQCLALFQSLPQTDNLNRSRVAQIFQGFRASTLPPPDTSSYANAIVTKGCPSPAQQQQLSSRMMAVEQTISVNRPHVELVTVMGKAAIRGFLLNVRSRQLDLEREALRSDITLNRLLSFKILFMLGAGPPFAAAFVHSLTQIPPTTWSLQTALISGAGLLLPADYLIMILYGLDHRTLKLMKFSEAFLSGAQSWAYWSRDTWVPQLFLDMMTDRQVITSEQLASIIYFQQRDGLEYLFYRKDPLNTDGYCLLDVFFQRSWSNEQKENVPQMTLVLRSSLSDNAVRASERKEHKVVEDAPVKSARPSPWRQDVMRTMEDQKKDDCNHMN